MSKLSIITVNLNNATGLQRTMNSVFNQTFADYEYIIIDGGSTDSSMMQIKNHANKLVYWVSEKDKGIYNAMNKGIAKAGGDYLLFLNSGDELKHPGILEELSPFMDGTGIIYGNILLVESEHKSWVGHYPGTLDFSFFVEATLPHCASLIKRSLFDTVGLYDENLVICADWKFFMDAVCQHDMSYRHIDKVVSVFYLDGISSVEAGKSVIEKEKSMVLERDYPNLLKVHRESVRNRKPENETLKKILTRVRYRLHRHGIIKKL